MKRVRIATIPHIYETLLDALGPSHWWPAKSRFEIMIGAILTQNTSWGNVEKAIRNLEDHGVLNPNTMARIEQTRLASLIRSSGYYNQKAIKLKNFLRWFERYQFSEARVTEQHRHSPQPLRSELLSINGIGPETADSILCYAFELPFFVVDAYTIRLLQRLGFDQELLKYEPIRVLVEGELQRHRSSDGGRSSKPITQSTIVRDYNEFHALIVRHGNTICKKRAPRCSECPLRPECQNQP